MFISPAGASSAAYTGFSNTPAVGPSERRAPYLQAKPSHVSDHSMGLNDQEQVQLEDTVIPIGWAQIMWR